MTKALTNGAHHVGLTVPDLDAAAGFFCSTLGFSEVGGNPAYPSKFVRDGATLITMSAPSSSLHPSRSGVEQKTGISSARCPAASASNSRHRSRDVLTCPEPAYARSALHRPDSR